MKVYVMRHGTTVWNEKQITQGHSQNRLSENGKRLVQEKAIMYKDVPFDVIFSSPLMRTIQTADIINQYHGVKIIKDQRLIEIDQGTFTGRSKVDLTEEEKKLKFSHSRECGMESYESVCKRIFDFVSELKQNKAYENILVVTHNVCASAMAEMLSEKQLSLPKDGSLSSFNNAEVKCFEV